MPVQANMVSAGLSAIQAQAIQGRVASGLTATGSTQATALQLPADYNQFTTVAASTGAILPALNPGDEVTIYNKGANALSVYPPVGGAINAVATNGAYSVATATPFCVVACIAPLTYIASQSA
jgi:predicted deacylase